MFQDLLGIPHLDASQSFESLNEEEKEAIAGSTRGPPSVQPLPSQDDSVQRSSSPSRSLPSAVGRSPEISSYFDDMALTNVCKIFILSCLVLFETTKWSYSQTLCSPCDCFTFLDTDGFIYKREKLAI